MATFSVVMLNLTKRQCQPGLLSRCLLKAKDVRVLSDLNFHTLKRRNVLNLSPVTAAHVQRNGFFLPGHCGGEPHHRALFKGLESSSSRFTVIHRYESSSNTSQSTASSSSDKPKIDNSSNQDKENDGKTSEEKPKKESWWRGKNSWRLGLIFMGGACVVWGIALVTSWGAPELDPDGNEIKDEYTESPTVIAYLKRTWKEMNIFKQKIQDPSRDKLLPDPLKYPYIQPPYTLAIELTGVLIHPDWTYSTGWRFKKRPAIDYFLQNVGPPLFEVVIYSKESGMTADPLVNHLDPQGFIMYRLYRDATRYKDGVHLKDISCLNRDMSRVIMLDCSEDAVKLYPRNALIMKKWEGEDEDRTLIDLAHFLKTVAASGVEDIRPVLDYYHQFDDPLAAFKENQLKLQEEEAARAKAAAESSKKKSWLAGFRKP